LHGLTTFGHQTGLTIVLESGIGFLFISPETYNTIITKDFLKQCPFSGWEEIKLLEGDPGSYCTIARRAGDEWYVGSICNESRTSSFSLSFLGDGKYNVKIYRDGSKDSEIVKDIRTLTNKDTLSIDCRKHGGYAISLAPIAPVLK